MGLQGTVRAYGLTSGFRAKCTMRNAAWRNTWQAGVRSVQRAMRPIPIDLGHKDWGVWWGWGQIKSSTAKSTSLATHFH